MQQQPKKSPAQKEAERAAEERKAQDEWVTEELIKQVSMALSPGVTATVTQVQSAFAMMSYIAFKKQVTDPSFQEIMDLIFEGVAQIEGIKAEMRILRAYDLPLTETHKNTLLAAAQLSESAVNDVREKLYEKLQLVRQCKQPGVTVH